MAALARILSTLALLTAALAASLPGAAGAQSVAPPETARPSAETAPSPQRQTLEDILARQRGEAVPVRPSPELMQEAESGAAAEAGVPAPGGALGPRGSASDSLLWEALRFGVPVGGEDFTLSSGGVAASPPIQDSGMWWLDFRHGPLMDWGGYLLLGTIGLLALFYLLRGRIRIAHGRSGIRILRFTAIERFAHWLLAVSFLLLAVSGLITLFGRTGLIPLVGKDGYASLALVSKFVHNNVAWPFMLALVLVFLFWVIHNLPSRTDLAWIARGGGIIGNGHPPAKKFNAGQKLIFWSVIILGGSLSLSGLSLLFPFELPMFAKTFAVLNDIGVPGWFGRDALPEQMKPQEEMQYAQLWHAIVGFVLMAIALAHIYIGTLGMEGAFDAMGSGEVDLNWAREHHSIWADEAVARRDDLPRDGRAAHPAE